MFLEVLKKQNPFHNGRYRPRFPKVFELVRVNMKGIEKAVKAGYSWTQIERALGEVYGHDINKGEHFEGYARDYYKRIKKEEGNNELF